MNSFIIIEYHSIDEVNKAMESLNKDGKRANDEIIISSNSLYPADKKTAIQKESEGKWVFNEKNGGFAYGMNEGLKVAKGEILIVMNSDVKIISSLEPMIDYLKSHPEVGIIAPKIIDDNGIIQDSFRNFVTPLRFIERQLGRFIYRNKLYVRKLEKPTKVDWVIGAFMMIRRDFYDKVGGMSEDYFMYCEDMEWCKRTQVTGYDVVYYPGTVIEYKGTRSARKHWKYAKIHIKSILTFWKKYGMF